MTSEMMINKVEMLTEAELNEISGGDIVGTANNSILLYEHGLMNDWYVDLPTLFSWKSRSKQVDEGWGRAGIHCETRWFNPNKYSLNGKQIKPEEAIDYIKKNFKKIRTAK